MTHKVETQWMGKMQFNALINGHTIIMDAPERIGGEDHGPIPKPFVLSALSGCTGMDVIALLRKAGITPGNFAIYVSGEVSQSPPIEYTSAHITYDIIGKEENMQAAIDAVNTSQEKICGVSHMLKKIMPVTWEVIYNHKTVFTNRAVNLLITQ
jgi:putative redox protein